MQSENSVRFVKWGIAAAVIGSVLVGVSVVRSGAPEEVTYDAADKAKWTTRILKHSRSGNIEDALQLLETATQRQLMSDLDSRLLKGQLLIELQKYEEAERVLTAAANQYSDSYEAHNNLAIALSRLGKYERSMDMLVKALETHPGYHKVYENINSLSAAMTSGAYLKALKLENNARVVPMSYLGGSDQIAQVKPSVLAEQPNIAGKGDQVERQADSEAAEKTQALLASTQSFLQELDKSGADQFESNEKTLESSASEAQLASSENEAVQQRIVYPEDENSGVTAQQKVAAKEASNEVLALLDDLNISEDKAVEKEMAAVTDVKKAAQVAQDTVSQEAITASADDYSQAISEQVQAWARAWSTKDLERYYSSYVSDYSSRRYATNKKWRKERAKRINRAKNIQVGIGELSVQLVNPNTATATFVQSYQASNYADKTRKEFRLLNVNGEWLISEVKTIPI
ncbi:tetratricopeptide repeat protein [Neptunomonas marina]|uniref:Tetratricopeptide repeat protein n=1 Tax=Neptunomonas marina TaxID=1815562 RepID=A0A437Q9I0_9GAMM|nr:tetratricopeptide repeat protein [Neptunomonas marina]RVU31097.1 tetratricopeptide repeat protein [Neptunomonas marina]